MHFPIKSRRHESQVLTKEPCLSASDTLYCTSTFRECLPQVSSSEDLKKANAILGVTAVSPAPPCPLPSPGARDSRRHGCATLSPGTSLLAAADLVLNTHSTLRSFGFAKSHMMVFLPPTQFGDFFGLFKLSHARAK